MSRLPIRIRLTLAFALAMAIVLVAAGAFVYVRLGDSLTEQLDESLDARAAALTPLVRSGEPLPPSGDEQLAEVASASGSELVTADEVARAREERFVTENDDVEAFEGEPARLLLTPVRMDGGTEVLVVGASLEEREEALDGLLAALLIGAPLALLAASAAGYLLAGSALRPVERMRRRAEEVSGDEPGGARLPLPEAHDEIRRLGTTLNEMLDRLEDGLERERRFTADASHELRTPLALLETELELALRRPRSPEELEAALRSAAEEVDRLRRLADDLLVLAQLDRGQVPLRHERIAAHELLETVARRFDARAAVEGRTLDVDATSVSLSGDRLRLEQALGNLVDNAFRHGAGTVRLSTAAENGVVELRVADDGAGFPTDFLPHAFERFSRPDGARSGGTAGLGLAIVAAVAEAHGGTANASNDGGAVVTIALPLRATHAAP